MPAFPPEITQRQVGTREEIARAWVGRRSNSPAPIHIVEYDPAWPERFEQASAAIRAALAHAALSVEHVGSTSVPGLPAKPIIDIDLTVADTESERSFVPALEAIGYELVLREPNWNGHRMLNDADATINLHVFPSGAPELVRHLLFRDWLRTHPDDRELYAAAKMRLAESTRNDPGAYNLDKNTVIDEIFGRIFEAAAAEPNPPRHGEPH